MLLIQFKSNKMLVRLSIIFLTISTLIKAEVTELLDLPLIMSDGELVIDAEMLAPFQNEIFKLKETVLASESAITGKITVWNRRRTDSYDIHYQFDRSGEDSKERLVMHGDDHTIYNHSKMTQNANLFGTSGNKPLSDLILLMGPSIIYRLAGPSIVWSEATHGGLEALKHVKTTVNKTLKITLSYKDKYDTSYGVKHPTRIEFNVLIYEPSPFTPKEQLLLFVHLQQFNPAQFDASKYKVQPSPGIGCPNYLIKSERKSIPKLLTIKYVSFNMYEEIEGSTNNRSFSEIMASRNRLLMKLEPNLTGVETEVLYDNELGIILTLEEGGRCQITIGDKKSPGRDAKGYFKLENLFYFDGDFNYIGKTNLGDQFEFPVDTWESVQFNVDFEGNKVDKFVVTQFFVESPNSAIFNGFSLVQTMISIYYNSSSNSSKKSYVLAKRIRRDYMNFQAAETDYELYDYFMLNDCKYLLSDGKVTLNFKIGCEKWIIPASILFPERNTDCIKLANRRLPQFDKEFTDAILMYDRISQQRNVVIQYNSPDSQIELNVTFLSKYNYDDLLKPKKMLVSSEALDVARTLSASDERECLNQLHHVFEIFAVAIWRSSDSFCGYLKKFADFKEDAKNGKSCNVYIFPFEKYIDTELELDNLERSFLSYKFKTFSMKDPDSQRSVSYKILDIVRVTQLEESDISLYHKIKGNSYIKIDDKTTLALGRIATFADCLRACLISKELHCNSFSFCAGFRDCRLSSLIESDFTDTANEERNTRCSIFSMNALRFYSKVPKRKFKKQISTSIMQSATACAQECLNSDDCISIQDCGHSCSFNSYYTDSTTEYDENCAIYYPKVSHKYRNTGNKIVSEVIHTEMNLNLDQCASLCHGWADGNTRCKSFKYCPINQMASSCSLTKFSVKSSDENSTEGGYCFNYEFIPQSNDKNNEGSSESKLIKGTSESNAFGIIMMFLVVVFLLVFSAPCVYEKIKPKRVFAQVSESFTCTRKGNEQPGTTNLNMSDF